MEALSLKVRSDLRRHRQNLLDQHNRHWRKIQIVVLLSSIVLFIIHLFISDWPYRNILTIYLFAPVFFLIGLERFWDGLSQKKLLTFAFVFILSALTASAGLFNPRLQSPLSPYSGWFGLLIPLIIFSLATWLAKKNPAQARCFSLLPYKPTIHILAGLFFGVGVAIHFLLVARFFPDASQQTGPIQLQYIAWLIGILAGLIVPAEELLFRGVAFSILFDGIGNSILRTIMRISTLNLIAYLPIFLVLVEDMQHLPSALLAFIYKGLLSAISVYVIYRWRNLYVTFVANLAFALVVIHRFLP